MEKFNEYRKLYPNFIYNGFDIKYIEDIMEIIYDFEIPGLSKFNPRLRINKKFITNKNINEEYLNYLVFHIGMIELISYIKCTCSPNIIIRAGYLNDKQISWFKKLYYYGLGEFLYLNNIEISIALPIIIPIKIYIHQLPVYLAKPTASYYLSSFKSSLI